MWAPKRKDFTMQTLSHNRSAPDTADRTQTHETPEAPEPNSHSAGWHLKQAWQTAQQQLPTWLQRFTGRSVPTWAVVVVVLLLGAIALD
jgi:hypothetical protein